MDWGRSYSKKKRPSSPFDDQRHRQERRQRVADHDGSGAGTAAAVRRAERLVRVEVDDVEAHVAGPADAEHRVGVGAVVVQEPAGLVDEAGDLGDVLVEQAERVGVGEHEPGDVAAGDDLAQGVHVHAAARVAAHRRRLEAGHDHARRIRAVRRVRDDDPLGVAPLGEVRGADHEQSRQLAVRSGGRLQRGRVQAGDLGQPALELVHQLERPLDERLGLVRVETREAVEAGGRLVDARVVLHRARAQRVAAAVDAVVERREAGEVAQQVDLADLGQARRSAAPERLGDELVRRDLGHARLGQRERAAAGAGLLVDRRAVDRRRPADGGAVAVSHGPPPRW